MPIHSNHNSPPRPTVAALWLKGFRGPLQKLLPNVIRSAVGAGPEENEVVFAGRQQQAAVGGRRDVEDVARVAGVVGDAQSGLQVPDGYAAAMIAKQDQVRVAAEQMHPMDAARSSYRADRLKRL